MWSDLSDTGAKILFDRISKAFTMFDSSAPNLRDDQKEGSAKAPEEPNDELDLEDTESLVTPIARGISHLVVDDCDNTTTADEYNTTDDWQCVPDE